MYFVVLNAIILRLMARTHHFVCIHGHFYQPPRENPWTGEIERQEGAHPFHDWNEKITAECYAPNSCAHILNGDGSIERVIDNYEKISFNFGPTLLRWMETHAPRSYHAILRADRSGYERFSGHGPAIAQAYHHSILPLCNFRDKRTEVIWGIRDFQSRFGRMPEGMWLPETAVDLASLEVLASQGIQFAILSPFQAARVRKKAHSHWKDVRGGSIDPQKPYEVELPSGGRFHLFFYNAEIARAVAFDNLLVNGGRLADQLSESLAQKRGYRLAHFATDGETYGHHHRFGEMALAYALHSIEQSASARLTVYGEFLELSPAEERVEIIERSAWSCVHGIGRWMTDCGCQTGARPGWTQSWRGPLREALDWLRDQLGPLYEAELARYLGDPWKARDRYVDVVLNPARESRRAFLSDCGADGQLSEEQEKRVFGLLEMQRYLLMMYTSCGWFFSDLSGIETIQILRYAARAVELAEEFLRPGVEEGFVSRLSQAESNLEEEGNGRDIYERRVLTDRPVEQKIFARTSGQDTLEYGPS